MALTTANYIIDELIPAKNFDPALIEDSIELAELKYLKKALGQELYELLVQEHTATSYTGQNETLIENYLQPTLARYTVYEALPLIRAELTANGLQATMPTLIAPANEQMYAALRNKMLSDAELLLDEMLSFIKDNAADFPSFTVCVEHVSSKTLPYLY